MDRDAGSLSLDDIEAGLERLMPRGLTDTAREDLESVVDELASDSKVISFWKRPFVWQSAAAILITTLGGALVAKKVPPALNAPAMVPLAVLEVVPGIEILEQMTWIEGGTDLGVQAINDAGDVSRGWSYVGVEEERILHEGSGYEVILQREFEAELYASSSL
ncbi:MAG: hypothetical protein ACSHYB_06975 [Roseibacillus sp.]